MNKPLTDEELEQLKESHEEAKTLLNFEPNDYRHRKMIGIIGRLIITVDSVKGEWNNE